MKYWLMKSEPDVFGIADLKSRPRQTEPWDGVRNYQARNFLRAMKPGDQAFFYHSSCAEPGVAGIVRIVRAAYPDPSAFDPKSPFFDARSAPEKPVWFMVDVKLLREMKRLVPLSELKTKATLKNMRLLSRGNRLSVMPVTATEWNAILKLEKD
ncbi:MAG: EVE domain-containing protein [Bacteroidota bacterium]